MVLDLAALFVTPATLLLLVMVDGWFDCDATVFLNIVVIVTCLCYGALVRCGYCVGSSTLTKSSPCRSYYQFLCM